MKLNILGTEYDYRETTDKEDQGLVGSGGYCDGFAKIIAIETDNNPNDPCSVKDLDAVSRKVKRHEVVHAFLYESGLEDMSRNELLVDWIAAQFPKTLKTFEEIGAL